MAIWQNIQPKGKQNLLLSSNVLIPFKRNANKMSKEEEEEEEEDEDDEKV